LSSWGIDVTCAIDGEDALNKYLDTDNNYYEFPDWSM
jgi:hypothetical protein